MKIFSFLHNLIDHLFVVAGALVGSQIPEFLQQYRQRLAGHVEALQFQIERLRQIAALSNKTLQEYILKFQQSSDSDFSQQGTFMQGILDRFQNLQMSLLSLTESSAWLQPYYFLRHMQVDIAKSTASTFQPGINLTLQGLFYGALGMFLGWLIYQAIFQSGRFIWNKLFRHKSSSVKL